MFGEAGVCGTVEFMTLGSPNHMASPWGDTANKVPGIRAAVCHDVYSAERARKSNDCQVMALGARVVGEEYAKSLVDTWLKSDFEGGKSSAKVERIKEIEQELSASKELAGPRTPRTHYATNHQRCFPGDRGRPGRNHFLSP